MPTLCGLSALTRGTNAPNVLRREAFDYAVPAGDLGTPLGAAKHHGATVFGSATRVKSEKAIVANVSAVREWDSNGTNFGYNPGLGHTAGRVRAERLLPGRDRGFSDAWMRWRDRSQRPWCAWMRSAGDWERCSASRPTRSITCCTVRSRPRRSMAQCSAQLPSRSRARSGWSLRTTCRSGRSAQASS